ncbi:hypothetical protein EAH86_17645 [Pedococcus bigeumensis]|uniref:PIN like domain-containing protein n=1 Tax=Pedococcus bigeumensis TaxID=433644 RepID=A0A502CPI3_9MICO|nr:hypothetical protein EAH86_17645 [Pedococcus bigeumensis]
MLKHFRSDPYLATSMAETLQDLHVALIMPGQTVIEFWNNHKTFAKEDWNQINSDVAKLNKKLDDMGALPLADQRIQGIQTTIAEIVTELQESTAPDFLQRSEQVMETLLEYAVQPMVSRAAFHDVGLVRLRSKVPPGFADAAEKGELSLGDFFGWCDFMLGALSLQADSQPSPRFLFVTEETKPDWRTGISAHPQLVHEFQHVTGGEVGVAYMKDLRRLLKEAVSASPVAATTGP